MLQQSETDDAGCIQQSVQPDSRQEHYVSELFVSNPLPHNNHLSRRFQSTMLVPLHARLNLVNLSQLDEDLETTETAIEEADDDSL